MNPAFVWINTVLEMLYSSMIATVVSLVISAQQSIGKIIACALHNEHFLWNLANQLFNEIKSTTKIFTCTV